MAESLLTKKRIGAVLGLATVYFLAVYFSTGTLGLSGQFGDTFGAFNAFFTALAFIGLWSTLTIQARQFELQRQELEEQRKQAAETLERDRRARERHALELSKRHVLLIRQHCDDYDLLIPDDIPATGLPNKEVYDEMEYVRWSAVELQRMKNGIRQTEWRKGNLEEFHKVRGAFNNNHELYVAHLDELIREGNVAVKEARDNLRGVLREVEKNLDRLLGIVPPRRGEEHMLPAHIQDLIHAGDAEVIRSRERRVQAADAWADLYTHEEQEEPVTKK